MIALQNGMIVEDRIEKPRLSNRRRGENGHHDGKREFVDGHNSPVLLSPQGWSGNATFSRCQ